MGTGTSDPRARLKMKQNRMVIAIQGDTVQIVPFSLLRYDGNRGKIFCGKIEVAASSAVDHIRLLPDRRYRQLLASRFAPGYYPDLWQRWVLDTWHVSTPLDPKSLEKIRKTT